MKSLMEKMEDINKGKVSVEEFKRYWIENNGKEYINELGWLEDDTRAERNWRKGKSSVRYSTSLLHRTCNIKKFDEEKEVIKFLIQEGINIDIQNEKISYVFDYPFHCRDSLEDPGTVLHHWQDDETLEILLRYGANPNLKNVSYGSTPLHMQVERFLNFSSEDYELYKCKLLLQYGANPYIKNKNGKDTFDLCKGQMKGDWLNYSSSFDPIYENNIHFSLKALCAQALFKHNKDNSCEVAHKIGQVLNNAEYLDIIKSFEQESESITEEEKKYALRAYLTTMMTHKIYESVA